MHYSVNSNKFIDHSQALYDDILQTGSGKLAINNNNFQIGAQNFEMKCNIFAKKHLDLVI